MACKVPMIRLSWLHSRRLAMSAASLIGLGTASDPVLNGAPVLSHGVPISADISKWASSPNTQGASMASRGSETEDNGFPSF